MRARGVAASLSPVAGVVAGAALENPLCIPSNGRRWIRGCQSRLRSGELGNGLIEGIVFQAEADAVVPRHRQGRLVLAEYGVDACRTSGAF